MADQVEQEKKRAADPTATAKRAAGKVRRKAGELTEALREAKEAGLSVEIRVGSLDLEEEHDADVKVPGATDVTVGEILASVSL